VSVSLDFLEILGRREKNKISQGGVWADLTPPPFVTGRGEERREEEGKGREGGRGEEGKVRGRGREEGRGEGRPLNANSWICPYIVNVNSLPSVRQYAPLIRLRRMALYKFVLID